MLNPCRSSSAPLTRLKTSIPHFLGIPQCLRCASREDHHRTPKHRLRPSFRPCVHHGMQAGSETIIGSGIREDHHWTPGPWKYHHRTSMPVVSCQARGCRMCACMHLLALCVSVWLGGWLAGRVCLFFCMCTCLCVCLCRNVSVAYARVCVG